MTTNYSSARRLGRRSWHPRPLILLTLGVALAAACACSCACSGDLVDFPADFPASLPLQCEPTGKNLQYVLTEYLGPQSDVRLEDFDGDGNPENLLGHYVASAHAAIGIPGFPEVSLLSLLNQNIAGGFGRLLFDVQAPESLGCSQVTLHTAAPGQKAPLQIALGNPPTVLRGKGTQAELATIPYSNLRDDNVQTLDLYLQAVQIPFHLRLYGARVTLHKVSDEAIEGTISGALRLRDLDETVWPVWARELTLLINHLGSLGRIDQLPADLQEKLVSIESRSTGLQKCQTDSNDCCHQNPAHCVILPQELQEYYAGAITPDLALFDLQGRWRPDPGAAQRSNDAFSLTLGFHAVRRPFEPACPAGQFCTQSLPENARILAGFATRSSELWVLTDTCKAWHHDGLQWSDPPLTICADPQPKLLGGSLWGASSTDLWAAVTPGSGWRRWDGARWRSAPVEYFWPLEILSVHGSAADDIWAIAAPSGGYGTLRYILRYQATLRYWTRQLPVSQKLTTVLSLWPDLAFAAGAPGSFLAFRAGNWTAYGNPELNAANLTGLASNSPANIWAVSSGTGFLGSSCFHFDGQEFSQPPHGFCGVPGKNYLSAWMDQRGVLWSAGDKGLLQVYDPSRHDRFQDVPHDADPQAPITKLFGVAAEGAVWAIVDGQKLLRYQP